MSENKPENNAERMSPQGAISLNVLGVIPGRGTHATAMLDSAVDLSTSFGRDDLRKVIHQMADLAIDDLVKQHEQLAALKKLPDVVEGING